MSIKIADLHVHSRYSDGSMLPMEILEKAKRESIGLLAITDHDCLTGSKELMELAKGSDIRCIPGAEFTSMQGDKSIHILAYGIDLYSKELSEFAEENSRRLESVNKRLISNMESAGCKGISLEDYLRFPCKKESGGWKALYYLVHKGYGSSFKDVRGLYMSYSSSYEMAGFLSPEQVIGHIHRAGGKAVLAHPGKNWGIMDKEFYEKKLRDILKLPFDGIECYYPFHSKEITETTLQICKEHKLFATSGSDSHGVFPLEDTPMGTPYIPINHVGI